MSQITKRPVLSAIASREPVVLNDSPITGSPSNTDHITGLPPFADQNATWPLSSPVAKSPYAALDLLAGAKRAKDRAGVLAGFAAEDEALDAEGYRPLDRRSYGETVVHIFAASSG